LFRNGSIFKRKLYLHEIYILGLTLFLADEKTLPENGKGQMPLSDYSKFDVAPDGKRWNYKFFALILSNIT